VLRLIEAARTRAVAAVNTTLIDLYWNVGEFISLKIADDGWGKGTVESLAETIQRRYPGTTGYSAPNLWRMRQFYEIYHDQPKLAPLVRELSWTHNLLIMSRCKRDEEREFYLRLCQRERCPLERATFVPPGPLQLLDHLQAWEKYVGGDDVDPLIQVSIVHAQLEMIHPFKDGNGRIGRLLIPLYLYQKRVLGTVSSQRPLIEWNLRPTCWFAVPWTPSNGWSGLKPRRFASVPVNLTFAVEESPPRP
jgi:predicted nuclease of restriction endonuclease-like (RecB) superfamily